MGPRTRPSQVSVATHIYLQIRLCNAHGQNWSSAPLGRVHDLSAHVIVSPGKMGVLSASRRGLAPSGSHLGAVGWVALLGAKEGIPGLGSKMRLPQTTAQRGLWESRQLGERGGRRETGDSFNPGQTGWDQGLVSSVRPKRGMLLVWPPHLSERPCDAWGGGGCDG